MIKKTLLLAISLVILLFSCSQGENSNNDSKDELNKTFLKNVRTTKAVLSNQEEELSLTGKVEYNPDKVITYKPIISGVIECTYFSLGDKVAKGQTLLNIRSSDLSTLQSDYVSAESEVKIRQRELQTAQSLYDDKMLSERDLIEAEAKLKHAQSLLTKVQNDMAVFGSNKGNGVFSIKAPMNGYIVEKKVSSGSPISADGDALFVVADLTNVWITVNVYASNLLFVKEGMDVEITALSYKDEVFRGKINTLSQVFDPEEKVLKARIVMPNKDLKFKPEMSVTVKLKDTSHNRLITIPSDALIFDDNHYFVVVEKSESQFETREVVLQGHNKQLTYIQSGLAENEQVVTKNQLLIYSGLKEY